MNVKNFKTSAELGGGFVLFGLACLWIVDLSDGRDAAGNIGVEVAGVEQPGALRGL